MPEALLESELFGYAKGAFADARSAKTGRFVAAQCGTLLLDEIGEMPVGLQPKLQERTVRPVGSTTEIPFDVRVVSATNRDLETMIEERLFRKDLYFRINVVQVPLPPLRARAGDILLLAQCFLERISADVKGENCVNVFGPEIVDNEKVANDITSTLSRVRGVEDLGFFKRLGQPTLRVVPDREAAARYGLNSGEVLSAMQAAGGGQAITKVCDGDKSFELTVRFREESRSTVTVSAIDSLLVSTPDGQRVSLDQIASVEMVVGPQAVYREDGRRYTPVSSPCADVISRATLTKRNPLSHVKFTPGWTRECRRQANATQEKAAAHVRIDVRIAWSGYRASRQIVERTRGGLLDRAHKAKEITEIQFRGGATSLMDMLDAERSWIQTNNAYLVSLTAYWISVFQLEAAVGSSLL